jgi:ABC-type transport system involved in cytochrome bd biosynthesis fused ATPase/permease subunit
VFRYAERLATHDAGLRSLTEIRSAVVARLADIAPAGVPDWQRGDLLQRVVADIDRLLDLFVRVLGPAVAVAATALGALVITAAMDISTALVLLTALVVIGVLLPMTTMRSTRPEQRTAGAFSPRPRVSSSSGRTGCCPRRDRTSIGPLRASTNWSTAVHVCGCSARPSSQRHRW